jgi:hypothetical protein
MPVIPALWRLRQEDPEFEESLDKVNKTMSQKKKKKKQTTNPYYLYALNFSISRSIT